MLFKGAGIFKSSDKQDSKTGDSGSNPGPVEVTSPLIPEDQTPQEQQVVPALKIEKTVEQIAQIQAFRSKMMSASFGEIIALLMRSPHYRQYSLADLEWLLIPPLMTNQFLVVEAQLKAPDVKGDGQENNLKSGELEPAEVPSKPATMGARVPVGMALWAKVSPKVDEKLSSNLDTPIKLRPDDWRSGEINWLIEIVGDQKIMQSLYAKLKK